MIRDIQASKNESQSFVWDRRLGVGDATTVGGGSTGKTFHKWLPIQKKPATSVRRVRPGSAAGPIVVAVRYRTNTVVLATGPTSAIVELRGVTQIVVNTLIDGIPSAPAILAAMGNLTPGGCENNIRKRRVGAPSADRAETHSAVKNRLGDE